VAEILDVTARFREIDGLVSISKKVVDICPTA